MLPEKDIYIQNMILEKIEANSRYKKKMLKVERAISKLYSLVREPGVSDDMLELQRLSAITRVLMDVIEIDDMDFATEIRQMVSDFEDAHP
jgi:type I site-specific restriction endonuclease